MNKPVVTPGLIAQHNLIDDEYQKIVGILGHELICIVMDS